MTSRRPIERGTEVIIQKPRTKKGEGGAGIQCTSLIAPREFALKRVKTQIGIDRVVERKKPKKPTIDDLKKEIEISDHLLSLEELAREWKESNINTRRPIESKGLTNQKAKALREIYGKNKLTPPKPTPWIFRFLKQFAQVFNLLLEISAVLCFIAFFIEYAQAPPGHLRFDNIYLGVVLLVVVFITAVFTFYQEQKSQKIMEGFKSLVPDEAIVFREGKLLKIPAEDLVPGDIVKIKQGDKIPADIRLIEVNGLKVDNSSLTGESELQSRTVEATHDNPLETKNIVFYGTWAKAGRAIGLVILTGDSTMMGKIAGLSQLATREKTPLHIEINRFIVFIGILALVLGFAFVTFGFIKGYDWIRNIVFALGIIIANVPEGLLAVVTVSLTLSAKKLAKVHVLVKNLEAVDTLGATTTIASDKTGTLTQNRMTVAHLWYDDAIHQCATLPTETHGFNPEDPTFKALYRCATLCNNARFDFAKPGNMEKPVNERACIGDGSETALIKFCEPIRSIKEFRAANPKLGEIPFNSENKWQVSIHELEDKNEKRKLLLMKGATERVIKYCHKILIKGKPVPLDDEWKQKIHDAYKQFGSMGERVMGFAELFLPLDEYPPNYPWKPKNISLVEQMNITKQMRTDLTFIGLVAMIDPPREGVIEAVYKCKTAGIRVIMVTGDHPLTATAIARQVGIIEGRTVDELAEEMGVPVSDVHKERAPAEVITGEDIPKLKKSDWDRILSKREIVFARTSPQQKLIIVEQCQLRGEIVTVTGDGVNDSPALKKANIGISMGIAGSDVSKESADMILMDDNFASIEQGIEQGRLVFENLKKSIAYTLGSKISQMIPFLLFIAIGIPLPLPPLLIIVIDVGTDIFPAISLAYEKPEADLMHRPPRDQKKDRLVTGRLLMYSYFQIGMFIAAAGLFAYFLSMAYYGFPPWTLPGLVDRGFFRDSRSLPIRNIRGQVISGAQQLEILHRAQTAYFVTVVLCRIMDVFIRKTRRQSLFHQGIFGNRMLLVAVLFEIILALVVVYIPGLNTGFFGTRPILGYFWLCAIPFMLFILVYAELRKLILRERPNGWVARTSEW